MQHKIGAIPFAVRDGRIALLFVTSKRKGRWIFPKGNRKKNESDNKASRREAFEEAGVKGRVFADFPITTVIGKASKPASQKAAVTYYPLLVSTQYDKFPEAKKRERHWILLENAENITAHEDYLNLIRQIRALSPWLLKTVADKKSLPLGRPKRGR